MSEIIKETPILVATARSYCIQYWKSHIRGTVLEGIFVIKCVSICALKKRKNNYLNKKITKDCIAELKRTHRPRFSLLFLQLILHFVLFCKDLT